MFSDAIGFHADVGLRTDFRAIWKNAPEDLCVGPFYSLGVGNSWYFSYISHCVALNFEYDFRVAGSDWHLLPGIGIGGGNILFQNATNRVQSAGFLAVPALRMEWFPVPDVCIGLETAWRYFRFDVSELSSLSASLSLSWQTAFNFWDIDLNDPIYVASNRQEFTVALETLLSNTDTGATISKSESNEVFLNCSDVLFGYRSTNLGASYSNTMATVAVLLTNFPGVSLIVEGYTDNVGDDNFNNKLSADRAAVVARLFLGYGTPKNRITSIGKGKDNPLFPNDSENNRAKNRRVKIRFLWKKL